MRSFAAPCADAGADAAVEVDRRLHEHAPELAEVRGRHPDGEPGPPRLADRDPHGELPVQVVLAGNRAASIRKSRLAWCFGMPQMPLPPLTDISVLTGRSYTYWPDAVVPLEKQRQQRGRGPQTVGDADGDAELDVLADVGRGVVDHGDHQHAPAPRSSSGWSSRPGQQPGRLVRVDAERGHERRGMVGRHGQLEGDPVDQRVASSFCARCARQSHRSRGLPHQLLPSNASRIMGNTSPSGVLTHEHVQMPVSRHHVQGVAALAVGGEVVEGALLAFREEAAVLLPRPAARRRRPCAARPTPKAAGNCGRPSTATRCPARCNASSGRRR